MEREYVRFPPLNQENTVSKSESLIKSDYWVVFCDVIWWNLLKSAVLLLFLCYCFRVIVFDVESKEDGDLLGGGRGNVGGYNGRRPLRDTSRILHAHGIIIMFLFFIYVKLFLCHSVMFEIRWDIRRMLLILDFSMWTGVDTWIVLCLNWQCLQCFYIPRMCLNFIFDCWVYKWDTCILNMTEIGLLSCSNNV